MKFMNGERLIVSTLLSLALAIFFLVTVVLPSEYGVDPTGAGKLLGLTDMGQVKEQLREETRQDGVTTTVSPEPPEAVAPRSSSPAAKLSVGEISEKKPSTGSDVLTVELGPNEAAEIKLRMDQGDKVYYYWYVNDGSVNFDTHGDPLTPRPGFYHGYGKGRSVTEDKGVLEAAFDGNHGWFWRNRSQKSVIVTLRVEGGYASIKQVL